MRVVLYALAAFGVTLSVWIANHFGDPTIEQVAYHLQYSEGLVSDTDHRFLVTFLVECVGVALVMVLALALLERAVGHRLSGPRRQWFRWFPAMAFMAGCATLLVQLQVPTYARSRLGADYFARHYVSPASVKLTPRASRNLLLIYVEGLETTYARQDLFGTNLVEPLQTLGGTTFARYRAAPGTGWTMGGIVGTQCGIPLRAVGLAEGKRSETFLPRAICLGDVLESLGYHNVFMGGARLTFAGKDAFLADHGYAERVGKSDWLRRGVGFGDMSDWGLHDDDLLDHAMAKLRELQAGRQRFNLTLLTLDTHHPDGFYSRRCKREGATDFAGIVACTARQVADFVKTAKESGLLDNTRVVIVGDHLAMPNPLDARLKQAPDRNIFNLFIGEGTPGKVVEEVLPFDMFPTILQFVGVDVQGGRLALGYAAFTDSPVRRSPEDAAALHDGVLNPSSIYLDLWRPLP